MASLSILCLCLAWASWRFVEIPFRSRSNIGRNAVFGLSATMLSLLFAAGILSHLLHGNLWRYDKKHMKILGNDKEHRSYVWTKKRALEGTGFDPRGKHRILVVGDSNSGDLLNAMSFMKSLQSTSLSSFTIASGCGNLYLDLAQFNHHLLPRQRTICERWGWYHGARKQTLLKQADTIVLASNWQPWELDFLKKSVANLKAVSGARVYIFGTKHVTWGSRTLLLASSGENQETSIRPVAEAREINQRLKALFGKSFIDPFEYLCDQTGCQLFDATGQPISFDGFHLTAAGAVWLGRQLEDSILSARVRHTYHDS